jgi:hypothetical protein
MHRRRLQSIVPSYCPIGTTTPRLVAANGGSRSPPGATNRATPQRSFGTGDIDRDESGSVRVKSQGLFNVTAPAEISSRLPAVRGIPFAIVACSSLLWSSAAGRAHILARRHTGVTPASSGSRRGRDLYYFQDRLNNAPVQDHHTE